MLFWYKFFTYLFYPLSHVYLFLRKIKKKEHFLRYKEKLSQINVPRNEGFLLWFHVASVGEAMSILPLIENFEEEKNINRILITTITLSSAEVLQKKFAQNKKVVHQFLPLDIPKFTNKFLNHWSPNLSIFIDSEIWPNLIFDIKKRNIPLLLINARITKKTFLRWKFVRNFATKIFEKFDSCLVSNNETEKYLQILGAKNIKNYGNIKFAKTKFNSENKLDPVFLEKIKSRKVWCAASTHPTEEIFCAKIHMELKKTYNNILTIIIPRHIHRIELIVKELSKLNLKTALYTNFKEMSDNADILLINTYGKALKFYEISKCVFLGKSTVKSLIEDSGQNPIEPARYGCKIFHGPNVSNFKEIYEFLGSLGVANKISSFPELSQSLVEELKNEKKNNEEIIKKIENYGQSTLNNVLKEIKTYINN
ncbi:MAG: glycosyltransferase N-terminal domain-containing protein [Pelagibacteraceae bacterium]|jgi:3-deoxy-D-manno-octulosonic-acid transferase|nr:3-deoxy-D-manno-octulosonic acid transferase [Candidatus Pelagibacter sp.]MDP6680819.1 glycosyltransferase N-terminal domain-containing protein [Pelagibacteraceae bacterium]MDP6710618.1 glycosyltransferase N-terminal domain-containing protein [Pelagibacteraceae bacterium]|tara:strand:- start:608 stop:1879 length:1272 start_codon:yes stop_codon:yes gene_type:complete